MVSNESLAKAVEEQWLRAPSRADVLPLHVMRINPIGAVSARPGQIANLHDPFTMGIRTRSLNTSC